MQLTARLRTLSVRTFSLLILFASSVQARDLVDQLPGTTRMLLRVPDGLRWVEGFGSTAIHGVIYSDTFKPLREHLGVASDGDRALRQVGLRAKDIRQLSHGEVILARVDKPDRSAPKSTRVGVPAPNDERATVTAFEVDLAVAEKVMAELKEELKRLGAVEERLSQANSFPVRFRWPEHAGSWIYSYRSGHFYVCDRQWLSDYFAEDSLSGSVGNLRGLDLFDQVMRGTADQFGAVEPADIEVQWFVAPWALVSPSETTNMLLAQGFGGIGAVGGRVYLTKNETKHCSLVVAARPLRKAAKGLAFVAGEVPKVPGWILNRAMGCLATQLDYSSALDGYGHWFDEKHGGGDEGLFDIVLEDIMSEPGAPGVDIRQDLVAQFDGPLLSVVTQSGDSDAIRLFAIHTKNQTKIAKTIQALLAGDPDVQQFKIDEHSCWKFSDLSRGGTRQVLGPDLSGLTICIARDYVIAAPQEQAVRRLLTQQADVQGGNAELQQVSQILNVDRPIGVGYSNSLGPIGKLYERVAGLTARKQAKSMALPELLRIFHIDANESEVDELRAKLPRVEELSKLFGKSIDAAKEVADGWLIKGIVSRKAD